MKNKSGEKQCDTLMAHKIDQNLYLKCSKNLEKITKIPKTVG